MKEVKKIWGGFKTFALNKKCTVKILTIKAGEAMSLQKHKNRKEEWYFLTPGIIQIGKKKKKVKSGDFVKIPKGGIHRASGGRKDFRILEISFGKFSEKDLTRLEDKYGRK